ncbi:hypothetical protein [Sedimentibacter sp.]|uniref:hypothetical protein n=1 Tax=Sedimentibacter sp. TaxID=1960295 RepID=UPI0028AF0417|nr:hypothetical protein [Sedimentibacter sp.]
MLFGKNRVEEDLEKIRRANLSNTELLEKEIKSTKENDLQLEKYDLLAIILAIMSLILPYIIAFVGIMAAVVFLLSCLY